MPDACFRPPVIFLSGPVSTPNCVDSNFDGRHTFFHATVLVVLGLLIIDYFVPDTDGSAAGVCGSGRLGGDMDR